MYVAGSEYFFKVLIDLREYFFQLMALVGGGSLLLGKAFEVGQPVFFTGLKQFSD